MPLDLTATASPLEAIWTVACLVTLGVNGWALWDAWGDVVATDHYLRIAPGSRGADPRLPLAARGAVRRELGRLVVMLAFVALGLFALSSPPTYRPDGSGNPNAMWLPLLAVGVAVLFAVDAIWDRRDRITLLRMTRARRETLREGD